MTDPMDWPRAPLTGRDHVADTPAPTLRDALAQALKAGCLCEANPARFADPIGHHERRADELLAHPALAAFAERAEIDVDALLDKVNPMRTGKYATMICERGSCSPHCHARDERVIAAALARPSDEPATGEAELREAELAEKASDR